MRAYHIFDLMTWPHYRTGTGRVSLLKCFSLFSFPPFLLVLFLLPLDLGSTFLSSWCRSLVLIFWLIYFIFLQYIKQYPPINSSSAIIDRPLLSVRYFLLSWSQGWGIWNQGTMHLTIYGRMPGAFNTLVAFILHELEKNTIKVTHMSHCTQLGK